MTNKTNEKHDALHPEYVRLVGVADFMPATTGFTMSCFKASDVPEGTELFVKSAANKAAEEGELSMEPIPRMLRAGRALHEHAKILGWQDDGEGAFEYVQRLSYERGMEDGRASRPVANKAEVDLESIEQYRMQMAAIASAAIGYWVESTGIKPEYDTMPLRDVAKLYAKYEALATPPATTGASTAPATIMVKAGNAFIAPPGTKVIHEEDQVGSSTVLTDERIQELVYQTYSRNFSYEADVTFARAVLREVAAQACQVAVPEGFVLVPVKPTPKMVDATFNHSQEKFGTVESHNTRNKRIYAAMLAAAPSPPKESK